jgi:hypothetical protein
MENPCLALIHKPLPHHHSWFVHKHLPKYDYRRYRQQQPNALLLAACRVQIERHDRLLRLHLIFLVVRFGHTTSTSYNGETQLTE